jgi:hypothetical protein
MESFEWIRVVARGFQAIGAAAALYGLFAVSDHPGRGPAVLTIGVVTGVAATVVHKWAVDNDPTSPPRSRR